MAGTRDDNLIGTAVPNPVIGETYTISGRSVVYQGTDKQPAADSTSAAASAAAPAYGSGPPKRNSPYSKHNKDRKTIKDVNDKSKKIDETTSTDGVDPVVETAKKVPNSDKPTTASAASNEKNIYNIVKKVDPNNQSAVVAQAVNNFMRVKGIMNMHSPAGVTNLLSGAIGGGISALANAFGLGNTLGPIAQLMNSGLVTGIALKALQTGFANTYKSAKRNNGKPALNTISNIIPRINPLYPTPNPIVTIVPDVYIQQYYATVEAEPYPGYIVWYDETSKTYVYTLRGEEPFYSSAEDHIVGHHTNVLYSGFSKTISGHKGGALDPTSLLLLANVVNQALSGTQTMGTQKTLGQGVNLGSILGLASSLIPQLSGVISGVQSGHLPNSVLNVGAMTNTMAAFTKNQALLAKKKNYMKQALEDNAEKDQALKDYVKEQTIQDANNKPPGTTVTNTTYLSDGTPYTYSITR